MNTIWTRLLKTQWGIFGGRLLIHWSVLMLPLVWVSLFWNSSHPFVSFGWATVVALALIVFAILPHELAHWFVARRLGIGGRIWIGFLLGAWLADSPYEFQRLSPRKRLAIVVAGPAINLFLGLVIAILRESPFRSYYDLLSWVLVFNLILAVTNMIPLYPLDGGQILQQLMRLGGFSPQKQRIVLCTASSIVYALGSYWLGNSRCWLTLFFLTLTAGAGFLIMFDSDFLFEQEVMDES